MPKADIAKLVSECLNRCRATGYTLTTLAGFIDELMESGQPAEDVYQVDSIMRHVLKDIHGAEESATGDVGDKPPPIDERD